MSEMIVTRFAPSPTGFMHIGSARTALFCYLFARHHGGKFLLRVEDTDRKRSTPEATQAILHGMAWLGLDYDGEAVYQSQNIERHKEVARALLAKGAAYESFEAADGTKTDKPAIRLKSPKGGQTILPDLIQGDVTFENDQMDDLVLLRSDGTPTYMLAVVVDDHDMGITHVIRGDDHLINAFRQFHIYEAMGWDAPKLAHMSLIHGADGAKLSKRHGALGVTDYKAMGILPEALGNYLTRLGWSHGDDEIFSRQQAIEWFDLNHVSKAPARLDMDKLLFVNHHYLKERQNKDLLELIQPFIDQNLSDAAKERYLKGMGDLKERAHTLKDIIEAGRFYTFEIPIPKDEKAAALLAKTDPAVLGSVKDILEKAGNWQSEVLFESVKAYANDNGLKVGKVAQAIRASVTGTTQGPSVFHVLEVLGKQETLNRL